MTTLNQVLMSPMFQCKKCRTTEFKLMLQPSFKGKVEIDTNEHDEVVVKVDDKEFIADLMFMNNFAYCAQCEATGAWNYYFDSKPETGN